MDEITDNNFIDIQNSEVPNNDPSLLILVLETTPGGWYKLRDQTSIMDVVKSILVFLNGHLALNPANQVAFILSSPSGSKFLYPDPEVEEVRQNEENHESGFVGKGMYRRFRIVDEAVLKELNDSLEQMKNSSPEQINGTSKLSGALSLALTYTNRMMKLDQSITTTKASAISSAANISNKESATTASSSTNTNSYGNTRMKSRILVITPNDNEDIRYIPLMKVIFGAQKMKIPIDIAKLGHKDLPYLQQAADATDGIYLHIDKPHGFIQVLSTAYFIEPSIRPFMILPTNSNVNYRASCFVSGKSVEIGFVCSVCLCIMAEIPNLMNCPTCGSQFDDKLVAKLQRKPVVKRRKVENGNGNGNASESS